MPDDSSRQLKNLGRAMVQANLRLSRVLELLEGGRDQAAGGSDLPAELLFDLLQALDDALEASSGALQPRPSWWRALLGGRGAPAPDPALLQGLELARQRALDRLRDLDIRPAPDEGPADPALHEVLQRLPCGSGAQPGCIAATHRRGWYRDNKGETEVLRLAQVSAYAQETP